MLHVAKYLCVLCLFYEDMYLVLYVLLCYRFNRNRRTVQTALLEFYGAIHKRIERVVFSNADVLARIVFCAALTYDDVTSLGEFAAEELQTKSF